MTAASLLRDLTAYSVQIALVALGVAVLLKLVRIPAGARYVGLRLALLASLVAPWLLRAPEVHAPALPSSGTQAMIAAPGLATGAASTPAERVTTSPPASSMPALPWMEVGFGALLIGIAARVVWLGMGVLRLLRLKRGGVVVDALEYSELQQQLRTRATIAHVAALPQPATFGVRRPIVLLPDALAAAPSSLRRAVVAHELFHVRRRDWVSVLAEEMVRTALWFHPAIHWMTAQIQLAREEIVDELTVRATGDRRTYVEALLAFADTPGLSPAPAFAHRRQLFHRILSVSKEKVMSRPRVVTSAAVLIAGVVGASWYASTLFPIVKAATAETPLWAQQAAADASTQAASRAVAGGNVESRDGAMTLRASVSRPEQRGNSVAVHSVTPENPIPRRTRGVALAWPAQLADIPTWVSVLVTVDRNGAVTSVDRDECRSGRNDLTACATAFDVVAAAVRQWRYDRPAQAPLQFHVDVTYRPGTEPTVTQSGGRASDWAAYLRETQDSLRVLAELTGRGDRVATDDFLKAQLAELAAQYRELERAQRLALERGPANPDLVKLQAELARMNDEMARVEAQIRNTKRAQALDEQLRADEERRKMNETIRALQEQVAQLNQAGTARVSATPPFAPFDGAPQLKSPSGRTPIRVTPPMKPPVPIKTVQPQYSAEALQARLQGTVAVEVLVDEKGHVADARVLRSIPLLDKAALEAARQWEFTPTLMNGEPVPILLQLEMNFTLK